MQAELFAAWQRTRGQLGGGALYDTSVHVRQLHGMASPQSGDPYGAAAEGEERGAGLQDTLGAPVVWQGKFT